MTNNHLRISIVVKLAPTLLILIRLIQSSESFYHPRIRQTTNQSYNTRSKNKNKNHRHNPSSSSSRHLIPVFAIRGGSNHRHNSNRSERIQIQVSLESSSLIKKKSSSSSSSSSKSSKSNPLGIMNNSNPNNPWSTSNNEVDEEDNKEGRCDNDDDDNSTTSNSKEFVLEDDRILYSLPSPGDNNREDWEINNNRDDMNKYVQTLQDDGVVVIPNVYTKNQIKKMIKQQKRIHKKVKKMMSNEDVEPVNKPYRHDFDKKRYLLMKHYEIEDEDDDDEEYEVIEISPGRYDYVYGMNDDERYPIFNSNEYCCPSILSELMDTLLVADYKSYSGCLPSDGKSNDGPWHRDTYILFDDESIDIKLPPYYYTVLIPLVPIGVENGATEFMPGSHKMTCKDSMAMDDSNDSNRFQASIKESDLGSIIVFDGRICHRGLRNLTDQNRTVLYMVWTKKWYNDY